MLFRDGVVIFLIGRLDFLAEDTHHKKVVKLIFIC